MKLIIDVPEEDYNEIVKSNGPFLFAYYNWIRNGIPLSEYNQVITIDNKNYTLTDKPILKTMDKNGLCSICGFREVLNET